MKIKGFVPAKSTSERLLSKNYLSICGKPLFLNAAYNLSKCLPKKDIFVDSDSEFFLQMASDHGFSCFKRNGEASNKVDGNKLLLNEIYQEDCDIAIQHLPTMPFLRQKTLEKIIGGVTGPGYDSVLAFLREKFYLWRDGKPLYDTKNIPNSKDLPDTKLESMGIYAVKKNYFIKNKARVGGRIFEIELDKWEAIDINTENEYEYAKQICSKFRD